MAQEIAAQTDTPLALPDSPEQQWRRVGRWIASHDSGQIPPTLMDDAKAVLASIEVKLVSATRKQFYAQMILCLDLCAGSGMGDSEREAWLNAAAVTLRGIPYDLLERGCAAARKYADHPSKIIPSITKEIDKSWSDRKNERNRLQSRMLPEQKKYPWERVEEEFDPATRCKPEEVAEILAKDGHDLNVTRDLNLGRDCSKLRQPTAAELEEIAASFKAKVPTESDLKGLSPRVPKPSPSENETPERQSAAQ